MTAPKKPAKHKHKAEVLMDAPIPPTRRELIEKARRTAKLHTRSHEDWLLVMQMLGIADPITEDNV